METVNELVIIELRLKYLGNLVLFQDLGSIHCMSFKLHGFHDLVLCQDRCMNIGSFYRKRLQLIIISLCKCMMILNIVVRSLIKQAPRQIPLNSSVVMTAMNSR